METFKAIAYQRISFVFDVRRGPISLIKFDHFFVQLQLMWLLYLACLAGFAGHIENCVAGDTLSGC